MVPNNQIVKAPSREVFELPEQIEHRMYPATRTAAVRAVDHDLRQPLMWNPEMVVGREGKKICRRDRMGIPDHLARLEVPPHIGIIESLANRSDSEHDKKTRQHPWE
jgi:hypothetical protein